MERKERLENYRCFMGVNSWEIRSMDTSIRSIVVNDGPLGTRKPVDNDFTNQNEILETVCLLSPAALAASFSEEVCYENGRLLALDCLSKKVDVLLAPGINIKRSALCGRNFEYFSEDPFLAGFLASAYIRGIEENGASACVKHYVANNQESFRMTNSSELSLRALNEIYLWPFAYVIQHAHPSVLMTSYNRVNGVYVNESSYLLKKKLRQEYGFRGLIVSDWTAVMHKGKTIHAGLDVEMPVSKRRMEEIDSRYQKDFTLQDIIERRDEICHSLAAIVQKESPVVEYDFKKVHARAKELAKETFVLLKNEKQYLPFSTQEKTLVIGYFADHPRFVGGGSAWVNTHQKISFLDVLRKENIPFDYIEGYQEGKSLLDSFSSLQEYKQVLVFLGQYENDEGEGWDRASLSMHDEQLEVLKALKKRHIPYASIIVTGSVIDISYVKKEAKSIIVSYLSGEGMYEALCDTLYGKSNPSGRLPETWISSTRAHPLYKNWKKHPIYASYYDEDIFVGYRYYDMKGESKTISYAFGEGMSYSTFVWDHFTIALKNDQIQICGKIKNISPFDGKEVIQIYVGNKESAVYRPLKELKAIQKIDISSQEEKEIEVQIPLSLLSIYDVESDTMKIEKGIYQVYIGKNVKEILFMQEIEVPGEVISEQKEIPVLRRKSKPKKATMMTPVLEVLKDEKFIEMLHQKHPSLDVEKFFKERSWMLFEPIRNITFNGELDIDFDFLKQYYK